MGLLKLYPDFEGKKNKTKHNKNGKGRLSPGKLWDRNFGGYTLAGPRVCDVSRACDLLMIEWKHPELISM